MIDVHCPDSPTGRHEVVNWSSAHHGLYCFWCAKRIAGQDLVNAVNAAMMLTADEAERYDSDEQLGNYARTWRGE
jgi:hypothetical protein